MADGCDEGLLDRVLEAAHGCVGDRSPLYRWLWNHRDTIAARMTRPDWKAMAACFASAGVTDGSGKPPTPTTVRQTWWKVERDMKANPGRA